MSRRISTTVLRRQLLGGFLTRVTAGLEPHSRTGSRLALVAHYGASTIVKLP